MYEDAHLEAQYEERNGGADWHDYVGVHFQDSWNEYEELVGPDNDDIEEDE